MTSINAALRAVASRAHRATLLMAQGGEWAFAFSDKARHNLIWFWFDGLFAAASDNLIITYLSVYILTLGATGSQIGLLSSLSSLSAAVMLLPGALLVERVGQRKRLNLLFGGGLARAAVLLLALLPWIGDHPALIALAIALAVARDAFGNLSFPAWMSLTADIVPLAGRGRYFASRNFVMSLAGMITTLLFGLLITRMPEPQGYQLTLGVAVAIGLLSTFSFSRLKVSAARQVDGEPASFSPRHLIRGLAAQPGFVGLAGAAALWNLSLNIAGPFFNVYLVENLGASAAMVGLSSIASSVAVLIFRRQLGELADRWGSRRMQLISGLLIPLLPLCWLFIRAPWQAAAVNLVGGGLWAAYNLASFNYLLSQTPENARARFSAIYQVVVTLSLAAGAALGGFIVTHLGYPAIFVGSMAGRLVAALIFARISSVPLESARAAEAH